jgi:hypothetical protein
MRKEDKKPGLFARTYHYFVTMPDRWYPFGCEIEGQWVRGVRSYDRALARAYRRYGRGHYGYGLAFYRQAFHLAGSLLVMYVATLVAFGLFGSSTALAVLLLLATLCITYQEFFLQRRTYHQLWRKGVADWSVWVLPMALYLFLFR